MIDYEERFGVEIPAATPWQIDLGMGWGKTKLMKIDEKVAI